MTERECFTYRDKQGQAHIFFQQPRFHTMKSCIERLRQYEDTGLSPQEVVHIKSGGVENANTATII